MRMNVVTKSLIGLCFLTDIGSPAGAADAAPSTVAGPVTFTR
jgi:hypothetical protein